MSDVSPASEPQLPAFPPPPAEPPVFPAARQKSGRRVRRLAVIASLVVVAVALVSVGAYYLAGNVYASQRIARAHAAINAAALHRGELDRTFTTISSLWNNNQQMTATQVAKLVGDFIQTWKAQGVTVGADDATLATAGSKLQRERWLTRLSSGSLDHESTRVAHARKAMAAAATIAADCMLNGKFLQALAAVSADLATLDAASKLSDPAGFRQALDKLTPDVTQALGLSTGPGLPPVVHELMIDFGELAKDYVAYVDASANGSATAVQATQARVLADENALQALDTGHAGLDVVAFYQPFIDTYRNELDLAAA